MPRVYTYKLTINEEYWTNQLRKINKKLTYKDKKLLRSVKNEKQNNDSIARIHAKALTHGLYVSSLTDLVGDCMFESIEKTGFCEDRTEFRKMMCFIFFLFGDCKVITGFDDTLKNIFNMRNEIEYVYCHINRRLYKYTYYTMCTDMYTEGSWSRLSTEVLLTVISSFFKVRIHIYHDNGHIAKICDASLNDTLPMDDPSCNIYLGLIGEHHYVPLVQIPHGIDKSTIKCPKYSIKLKRFIEWANNKSDHIGLYIDNDDTDSDNDSDNNNGNHYGTISNPEIKKEDDHQDEYPQESANDTKIHIASYDTNVESPIETQNECTQTHKIEEIPEQCITNIIPDIPNIKVVKKTYSDEKPIILNQNNTLNQINTENIIEHTVVNYGNDKIIFENGLMFFI